MVDHLLVLTKFVLLLALLIVFAERHVMQLYHSRSGKIVMAVALLLGICAAVAVFIRTTDAVLACLLSANVAVAGFDIGCLLVDIVGAILVELGFG